MTNYVCTELAPAQSGYVACKTWVAQSGQTPVLTKEQVSEVGGALILFFSAVAGYLILAKAIKIV